MNIQKLYNRLIKKASSEETDSNKTLGRLKALGIGTLGTLPLQLPSALYTLKAANKDPLTLSKSEKALLEGLEDIIKRDPYILREAQEMMNFNPMATAFKDRSPFLSEGKEGIHKYITQKSYNNPFILAHEYGHTQNKMINDQVNNLLKGKKNLPLSSLLYGGGKFIPGLAGVGSLFTDNENLSLGINALGSASTIPMLVEEFQASKKGLDALQNIAKAKNIKLTKLQKLKPFMGTPTYIATALSPLAMHLGHKYGLGFKDKE